MTHIRNIYGTPSLDDLVDCATNFLHKALIAESSDNKLGSHSRYTQYRVKH